MPIINNYFLVHTTTGNLYSSIDGNNWNLLGQVSTQIVCMFNDQSGAKIFSTESINTSYLSDINISSPSNNQVLQYNGSKWVNNTFSSSSSINSCTDVSLTSEQNGDVLLWNSATSKYINSDKVSSVILTDSLISIRGYSYNWGIANDGLNDNLTIKRGATTLMTVCIFQ